MNTHLPPWSMEAPTNTADYNETPVDSPPSIPTGEGTQWLRETLSDIQNTLKVLDELTTAEIDAIDRKTLTALWTELPSDYALDLGNAVVKLNSLLYAYFENNWYNPLHLHQYQRKKKIQGLTNRATDVIRLRYSKDSVLVYMPYLPAKQNPQEDIVNDLLCARLSGERKLPTWVHHHIAFHHVYPENTTHIPRDVDNFNYKRTIDLLAFAMNHSDCAFTCSMEMRCHFTQNLAPGVYIKITPESSENNDFNLFAFAEFGAEN